MATQSVTKAVAFDHARLKSQVRNSLPIIDRASSSDEVELLILYRKANAADRKRLFKLAHAAKDGKLPTTRMTLKEGRVFADALP
jgi:hypothetical protein